MLVDVVFVTAPVLLTACLRVVVVVVVPHLTAVLLVCECAPLSEELAVSVTVVVHAFAGGTGTGTGTPARPG